MTTTHSATAIAHPNIALIKYWGDIDAELHIPANGSISMNLEELYTKATVSFDTEVAADQLWINNERAQGEPSDRVSDFLKYVRQMARISSFAMVNSTSNFPMSTGIASSASAFAALSLAASRAAGLTLSERELSRLARLGSGSACRSVPAGFVEWQAGTGDADSYAITLAPPDYWELSDCIAIVSREEKTASSKVGHSLANTSMVQQVRVSDAPRRLDICRQALQTHDFAALAEIVELDSNLMHFVMLTSQPPLLYWKPATISVIQAVQAWRKTGIPVCYTIDAGPNVHLLCPKEYEGNIAKRLEGLPGVIQVLISHPGGGAHID
jgi:diphosphomevalonate decarboxylase